MCRHHKKLKNQWRKIANKNHRIVKKLIAGKKLSAKNRALVA